MNDSEVESNYSGKISHVPGQRAVSPSPRSMLSRDKRLPLDTWNLSEPHENVFGNTRPMFDSSQTPYQGILHSTIPRATGAFPVQGTTGTPVARGEERIGSTTTLPMSARRPSTMNSFFYQRKFHRILWLNSRDCRHRNFNLTNYPYHQSFHVKR